MNRRSLVLSTSCFLLVALGLTGCGGGGGGSSTGTTPPVVTSIDADPKLSPAVDPAYYNVPSNPLGVIASGANVTFNYWNPTATAVSVALYANWNDSLASPAATIALTQGSAGIWSSGAVPKPAQNYYVIKVGSSYVGDPYARSAAQWVHQGATGISGDAIGKGAIVDPAALAPDGGWSATAYFDGSKMRAADGASAAPYAYAANRDAIIYEAGIRDLTVDPTLAGFASGHTWGTYKALTDMLPHIQKLGVTHVQLLCPLENYNYDQTRIGSRELSITQTAGANYNWGYDPKNYFTPTGMYSANPSDPSARINELKTLVNEIHKAGMGVILDVVYNHTANNEVLGDSILPSYYYRSTSNNGAGSKDVKSESKMMRKLIVDSIKQWVDGYHVDGFRFDLMGVIDTGTLSAAYAAAAASNPKVVFLGEGWNGYYSGPATDFNGAAVTGSDQNHAATFLGKNIAMFSDSYRQIFKNGYPNDGSPAFLTGTGQSPAQLFANISGTPTNAAPGFAPGSTNNVISYLTCHDNLCYYDVLAMATKATKADDGTILKRAKVGYAVLLTSQGVAFLHAGDEMFRSKETTTVGSNTKNNGVRYFVDNSYNASDAINMVKWSTVYSGNPITAGFGNYDTSQNGYQLYKYTQGLIALRKSSNAFRLPDSAITTRLTAINPTGMGATTLAFGYKAAATDGTGTFYVLHNADSSAHSYPVDASLIGAALVADGASAGTGAIATGTGVTLSADGLMVTVAPLTSAIFRK
jgi:pullulanase/glycogen debranching enzyme